MRILCIDVGTGTQDILLFDSSVEIENCVEMVMPSPTQIVAQQVRRATVGRQTLLLDGVTMGGGPGAWAVEAHIREGLPVFATPNAARTFDDDLERVVAMGVKVVESTELERMTRQAGEGGSVLIHMKDLNLPAIEAALGAFGVEPNWDALAVAVFDHGNAPPGYSDRKFRFDYISQKMARGGQQGVDKALAAFASPAQSLHPDLTRLAAVRDTVARSPHAELPLLLMDTGPAALLGALGDPVVREAVERNALFVNVGNFHVLAFHIVRGQIAALFEHHTGLVDGPKLVGLLASLAEGALTNEEVFDDSGHGALIVSPADGTPEVMLATGPRRSMLASTQTPWPVYMAVPHGDMMLAGCYGLLRAYAAHYPEAELDITPRLEAQH